MSFKRGDIIYRFCAFRCNVCFSKNQVLIDPKSEYREPPVKCSCRLVVYCSKEHQDEDRQNHEEICTAIQKILYVLKIEHPFDLCRPIKNSTYKEVNFVKLTLVSLIKSILARKLTRKELEVIFSSRKWCAICFDYNENHLSMCNNCQCSYYCTEHKEKFQTIHTKFFCSALYLNYNFISRHGDIYKLTPDKKMVRFSVLDALPSNLFELINYSQRIPVSIKPTNYFEMQKFHAVCHYSTVATLLFILKVPALRFTERSHLRIHVVGATTELFHLNREHCFVLFQWLPQLTHIRFELIGPKVLMDSGKLEIEYSPTQHFSSTPKRTVRLCVHKMNYQDYPPNSTESIDQIPHSDDQPDLIICFNAEFSVTNVETGQCSWTPALNAIMEAQLIRQIPFAFSAKHLSVAKDNCEVIANFADQNDLCVNWYRMETMSNAFRSQIPEIDFKHYNQMAYNNNFFNVGLFVAKDVDTPIS